MGQARHKAGCLNLHVLNHADGDERPRGARLGALCAVRRDCLTITERAGHARRLRRKGETAEADALESGTLALMDSGALVMTEKERKAFLK
jgi:hypothetical protein